MAADHDEHAGRVMKRGAAVGLRVVRHPDRSDEQQDVYDVYDAFQRSGKPIASQIGLEKVEEILDAAGG